MMFTDICANDIYMYSLTLSTLCIINWAKATQVYYDR